MKKLSLVVLLCCVFGSVGNATVWDKWWEDDHCGAFTITKCREKYEIYLDDKCFMYDFDCNKGDRHRFREFQREFSPDLNCGGDGTSKCSAKERKFFESKIIEINNCYSRCNAPRRLSDE